MQKPHILIIGAGLIGIANARAFIDRGAEVTLIERKAVTGHGAGFANSGMIHPSQAWPWIDGGLDETAQLCAARDVAKLAQSAPKKLRQRMAALSLTDKNREPGCFQIFDNVTARRIAQNRYDRINIKTETSEQLPRPALYFPDDFSGNAYTWCNAEIAALIADGLQLYTDTDIVLTPTLHGLKAVTKDQTIKADHIILCTGHRTNILLAPLGLSLPVLPIRGFSLDFDTTQIDLANLPNAPIMDAATRTALTQFDKVIRFSGTLSEKSAQPLWQRWCDIMPNLMKQLPRPHHVWSGERPVSLLGRPIISETPVKGLWVNTGHGHMGWTLSHTSAELMAQMILDGQAAPAFSWPHKI